jgi:hypothetical protein
VVNWDLGLSCDIDYFVAALLFARKQSLAPKIKRKIKQVRSS